MFLWCCRSITTWPEIYMFVCISESQRLQFWSKMFLLMRTFSAVASTTVFNISNISSFVIGWRHNKNRGIGRSDSSFLSPTYWSCESCVSMWPTQNQSNLTLTSWSLVITGHDDNQASPVSCRSICRSLFLLTFFIGSHFTDNSMTVLCNREGFHSANFLSLPKSHPTRERAILKVNPILTYEKYNVHKTKQIYK